MNKKRVDIVFIPYNTFINVCNKKYHSYVQNVTKAMTYKY